MTTTCPNSWKEDLKKKDILQIGSSLCIRNVRSKKLQRKLQKRIQVLSENFRAFQGDSEGHSHDASHHPFRSVLHYDPQFNDISLVE